jgi:hypothetical protein
MSGHYTRGIWGQTRVCHKKSRCGVCVPLSEHAGCSLLQHPTDRSRNINGSSAIKVVGRLG